MKAQSNRLLFENGHLFFLFWPFVHILSMKMVTSKRREANRAEITVLMCKQKLYPVSWLFCRRKAIQFSVNKA